MSLMRNDDDDDVSPILPERELPLYFCASKNRRTRTEESLNPLRAKSVVASALSLPSLALVSSGTEILTEVEF